jgi:hypothetical protein
VVSWEHYTSIEVLHEHVAAAMLDGRNNKNILHEDKLNFSKGDFIVLPSNMAAFR